MSISGSVYQILQYTTGILLDCFEYIVYLVRQSYCLFSINSVNKQLLGLSVISVETLFTDMLYIYMCMCVSVCIFFYSPLPPVFFFLRRPFYIAHAGVSFQSSCFRPREHCNRGCVLSCLAVHLCVFAYVQVRGQPQVLFLLKIFYFQYLKLSVYVWVCALVQMPQEVSDLDPLELKVQVFDYKLPDIRTKHRSPESTEHALNC